MMSTWLPETCWATIRRDIKNTKSDIQLVFLIHTELRCTDNRTSDLHKRGFYLWLTMGKQKVSQAPRGPRPSLWESLLQTTLTWNDLFLTSANTLPLYTLADTFFLYKIAFSHVEYLISLTRAHTQTCTRSSLYPLTYFQTTPHCVTKSHVTTIQSITYSVSQRNRVTGREVHLTTCITRVVV